MLILLCAGFGAGCHITGARVYNLDELHDANGRHKYRAALLTDTGWLMRQGFSGALRGFGAKIAVQDAEPSKVEDPTEACLENLNGLTDADSNDPDVAATQVEMCTRIVLTDPWRLSRERAALELGRAGARLELAKQPARVVGAQTATSEQLSDLLARFVKAVTPYVAGGDRAAAKADLERLATEARGYEYDGAGLPRLLRGVRLLASRLGRDIPALAELSLDLQARGVRMGLEHALDDEDGVVAAAASRAGRRAFGDAWCERVLARLARRDAQPELFIAYAEDSARNGLPEGAAHDPSLRMFYGLAHQHPDSRVSVAAMGALARASGGELTSLREEDWRDWWQTHAPASSSAPAAPKQPGESGQP
ncbi:MAG: hypothetical protein K8S98_12570 [Planctomycetes bacterium]|nr:hypothetical protein [Planctomycetota bacterium]